MKNKIINLGLIALILMQCTAGNDGQTREECAEPYLLAALFAKSLASRPTVTEESRARIEEGINNVLLAAALCKDESEKDIITDLFD